MVWYCASVCISDAIEKAGFYGIECQTRHDLNFFCSSLTNSKTMWLHPKEFKFGMYFICINTDRQPNEPFAHFPRCQANDRPTKRSLRMEIVAHFPHCQTNNRPAKRSLQREIFAHFPHRQTNNRPTDRNCRWNYLHIFQLSGQTASSLPVPVPWKN